MTLRQFVKAAGEVINAQKVQMADKIARGACPDMSAYNREVGRREGLDLAMGLLKDMLGQVEDQQTAGDQLPEMPPGGPQ